MAVLALKFTSFVTSKITISSIYSKNKTNVFDNQEIS